MTAGARRAAILGAWIATLALLFALPALQRTFDFALFNLIFLYSVFFWITQATSWNIFSGYSGYFSFGQGAFYGLGLYATGNLVVNYGTSLLPALPVGGLIGGLVALATGLLVFRLRKLSGEIFALFSLAVALALGALANNWSFIDGGRGIPIGSVDYPSWLGSTTEMLYYLALVLAVVSVGLAAAIQYSRLGSGLFAIRDDERVAEGIGVPTFRFKLWMFALNGVLAGVSGALHAVQVNFISPQTAFGITVPLFVILMSVVGGRRHWAGPVVGAVVIYTVSDRLTGAGFTELSQIVLGVLLIGATLFLRAGIAPRLLQRPLPATFTAVVVLAGQLIFSDEPVITSASIAMIAGILVLIIPDRAYRRVGIPLRTTGGDGSREPQDPHDEVPITEGATSGEQGSVP